MTASPTTSSSATSKADYCLQCAQAAKAAGNVSLQANNLRGASFNYKKVYLFLAEYLPPDVTGPSALIGGSSSTGGSGCDECSNNGLVQMLRQRRHIPVSSPLSTTEPTEQQWKMLQLYATALNNLALVHLKLGRYSEAVSCATAVLENPKLRAALDSTQTGVDPSTGNIDVLLTSATPAGKALQRRATCYAKLGNWAAAEADVKLLNDAHAKAGVTVDAVCEQLMKLIRQGRKTEAEKEKKMMQRMFA